VANSILPKETVDSNSVPRVPRIDIEVNTGLIWLLQIEGCVNIIDNVFIKGRHSETFLHSESGCMAGYQFVFSRMARMQFGLGYSSGKTEPLPGPGGPTAGDTTRHWNGMILDYNFIRYFNTNLVRIGMNVGFNCVIFSKESAPSLNLGLVIGLF
jgi:hypothetical protein